MLNLIVILPFISSLIIALVYLSNTKASRHFFYTLMGVGSLFIVTILSLWTLYEIIQGAPTIHTTLFTWLSLGSFNIELAFMADRLSVMMISFITFIGLLIHIYAVGYMKGEEGYGKFFAYFNLFMGSMLLLVLADNPIIMFIGWELVGLSSYLLIGFYHKNPSNITAANKAFMLNRVGDFGFIMAISLLFVSLEGTGFTFDTIKANISIVSHTNMTLIGILLFIGAMGKSAQIPLYVWLPDAMAGPTPVSALIHAATMVTAGVYMVARYSFLYIQIPDVGLFIASVGAASALFAAVLATYQSDIKKILAYSTMSQLGYMFIAVGLGAYSSGLFHVFTHAFFKALLFMGAGALIIAMHHEQNIFKMGALKDRLKLVYITMFIATLAISGIPPFSGFFSKDAILIAAFDQNHYILWIVATFTAGLTSFYMFRLIFIVFHAPNKERKTLHPLSKSMTYPLVILAIGSTFAGFINIPEFLQLPDIIISLKHSNELMIEGMNITVAISGMILAYLVYAFNPKEAEDKTLLGKLITNKFYVDEFYIAIIVKPLLYISDFIAKVIDPKIFDGFINLNVTLYMASSKQFAKLQNGNVRFYALYILAGVSVMSFYLIFKLGL
jgi:NADH-quinone oxidoreductase subunit L